MATVSKKIRKRPTANPRRNKPQRSLESHRKERDRKSKSSRESHSEQAEIGPPQLTIGQRSKGRRLRALCANDLEKFNTLVFPNSTGLKPFGQVQIDSIAHDQSIIENGGRVVKAEPRAYGKTTRGCNAALWAVLYGKRRMVPVFSANMDKSKTQIMEGWKTELTENDLLFWMFPNLLWPLRCLEGKAQRCQSQTMLGRPTKTIWTSKRIVFPDVPGEPGAGAMLVALPLKNARGANHKMQDGTVLRPDLLIFDDVQNDEDADNPQTIRKREEEIDHTALMLGGHSQTLSAIMNCTVRKPDDLGEMYLKKHGWRRVRYKMLTKPALRERELWLGPYADILKNYDPESAGDQRRALKDALEFYKKNRHEMDEGAEVSWEWCYKWNDSDPTEISAIQHAYNILIDLGESVFASECQNEPLRETGGLTILPAALIRKKQSGYPKGTFPNAVTTLTAAVDMHPGILYWHVWAFEQGFTSYLIADGTYPKQGRRNFSHDIVQRTLTEVFPGQDLGGMSFAALTALLHGDPESGEVGLMAKEFIRDDGVPLKISLCGIDASGQAADAVKKFVRTSPFSANLMPTFGKGVLAKTLPMNLWNEAGKGGGGDHWVRAKPKPGESPALKFDTNYWKTSFHRAMALPIGNRGAASLHNAENEEYWRRFSESCHSERVVEVIAEGRTVYEFGEPRPGSFNHDFDCAIIARVMASKAGISSVPVQPKKKRLSLAEYAMRARRGR